MADDSKVRLWRFKVIGRRPGPWHEEPPHPDDLNAIEWCIARPAADDEAREERLRAAEARATRCPLCQSELDVDEMDPDETDGLTEMRPDGAGVCSECYGRWHDAKVYKARAERAEAATREADARANTATVACDLMRARAEKAEAECAELRARLDAARGGAS